MFVLKNYLGNLPSMVRRHDEVKTINEFVFNRTGVRGQFPRYLSFLDENNILQTIDTHTLLIGNRREARRINRIIPDYVEGLIPQKTDQALARLSPEQKLIIQRVYQHAPMSVEIFKRLNE